MQYSGKPSTNIYRQSTRKKRLSLPMLLAMLVPLLLIVAVGAIFISNAVTHAASNDNAPVASGKNVNVAAANTPNSNVANTNSPTNNNAANNGNMANNNTANNSNMANNAAANNGTANNNTANNGNMVNNANKGTSNIQAQQANCTVNGTMIKGCNGTVTIKLMNGTTTPCSLVQNANVVALNCPANQNNQNTMVKTQQLTCTVNGAEVKSCSGLATITTSNDATTCSLATANSMVTLTCPAAVQPQAQPQNGQPAQQIQQPPHQKW